MNYFLGQKVNDKVIEIYENFKPSLMNDKTEPNCDDNDKLPSVFTTPIKDEESSIQDNSSSELFYDFQAENFHAEQVILLI